MDCVLLEKIYKAYIVVNMVKISDGCGDGEILYVKVAEWGNTSLL